MIIHAALLCAVGADVCVTDVAENFNTVMNTLITTYDTPSTQNEIQASLTRILDCVQSTPV